MTKLVHIPEPDLPEDEFNGNAGLELFDHIMGVFKHRPDLADELGRDEMFSVVNEFLAKEGKRQWDKATFAMWYLEAVQEWERKYEREWGHAALARVRQQARRHRKIRDTSEPRKPGRQPSDMTAIVRTIRENLGYSHAQAYRLATDASTNPEVRRTLAALFPDDPQMSVPAYWLPMQKARRPGRPSTVPTFRAYAESDTDDFEGDLTVFLDVVRRLYRNGSLPDDFRDLEHFLAELRAVGVNNPAMAVEAWGARRNGRHSNRNHRNSSHNSGNHEKNGKALVPTRSRTQIRKRLMFFS